MKKIKLNLPKLQLNKEKVSSLTSRQQNTLVGGKLAAPTKSENMVCTYFCNSDDNCHPTEISACYPSLDCESTWCPQ